MQCSFGDGGGPSAIAIQVEVAKHLLVLRTKIRGIERIGKGSLKGYQLCAAKLNESEELMKHR